MTRCGRGADIFVTSLPVFETSNLKLRWAGESSIDFPGGRDPRAGAVTSGANTLDFETSNGSGDVN